MDRIPKTGAPYNNVVDQQYPRKRTETRLNIKPSRQLNFIPIRITNRSLENEYDLIERMRSNRNVHNYSNLIKVQRLKPTIPQRSLPNILTFNARSILNKIDELAFVIHNHNSDIVTVSETWLSDDIPDEILTKDLPGGNRSRRMDINAQLNSQF